MRAGVAPRRKRGTSRAVPIVTAAGLAAGVFGGLMILLGTGEDDGAGTATIDAGVVAAPPDAAPPPDAPVDAALPDAGPPTATITFEIDPPDLDGVSITVDDEEVEGLTHDVVLAAEGEGQRVRIEARARGHYRTRLRPTITDDTTIEIELHERRQKPDDDEPDDGDGPGSIIDL